MLPATLFVLAVLGQQATLPGSNVSMEEAQQNATLIVVAEPTSFGDIIGVGAVSFGSVGLKPAATLKGEVGDQLAKRASLSASGYERMPEAGTEYIVFLYEYQGHPQIHKILPKTDQNLEAVKREIKAKAAKP